MGRWLTPQNPPPTVFWVRKLYVPADPAYGALVSGALINLCYASSFEQDGAATPDEVADAFAVMYEKYVNNSEEPPFWGDEDDVDQDAPVDQPWYESLSDWIIQGFLAISGFPTAAIVYSTSVPQIRLAIRNHDLGALFRVLLDNLEMYTGDSYGPIKQLVGHTLDLEAFAVANDLGPGPWQLRIEHAGPGPSLPSGQDGTLEVVRKRLTDEMPIQFRQTDPNVIEYSVDDGSSWSTTGDLRLATGTNSNQWQLDADGSGPTLKNDAGTLEVTAGQTVGLRIKTAQTATYIQIESSAAIHEIAGSNGALAIGGNEALPIVLRNDGYTYRLFVAANGQLFLGDGDSPTANIMVPAAGGVASGAPLKMVAGSLMATPEPGAIETDGTHLYWTDSGGTRHQID